MATIEMHQEHLDQLQLVVVREVIQLLVLRYQLVEMVSKLVM